MMESRAKLPAHPDYAQRLALVATAALAVTLAAASQSDEQAFIKEAVQSNLGEVQLGELAVQRAETETRGSRSFRAASSTPPS